MINPYYTSNEIQDMFNIHSQMDGVVKRYEKFQPVDARLAILGETILTVVNGVIETTNVAKEGQVVVMNMFTKSREQQLLFLDKFESRYIDAFKVSTEWTRFLNKGEVDAFEWLEDSIIFDAPWGESMIMNYGDYLCKVPNTIDDIYRIARTEFFETYRLKKEVNKN